jgi:hypothetical protein
MMRFSSLAIFFIGLLQVFADEITTYQVPTPPTDTWIIEALTFQRNQTVGTSGLGQITRPFNLRFNFYHAKYGSCESQWLWRKYPPTEDEQCLDWEYSKYAAVCSAVQYDNGTALPIRNPLEGFWQSCEGRHWSTSPCGNNTRGFDLVTNPKCQPFKEGIEAKEERPWVKWRVVDLDDSPYRNTIIKDGYSKPIKSITLEIVSGQT